MKHILFNLLAACMVLSINSMLNAFLTVEPTDEDYQRFEKQAQAFQEKIQAFQYGRSEKDAEKAILEASPTSPVELTKLRKQAKIFLIKRGKNILRRLEKQEEALQEAGTEEGPDFDSATTQFDAIQNKKEFIQDFLNKLEELGEVKE